MSAKAKRAPDTDLGPPERGNHGDTIELGGTGRGGVKRAYVVAQSPLERYRVRGLLGDGLDARRRLTAGLVLHQAFHRAGLYPRVTGAYEQTIPSGSIETFRVLSMDAYDFYMGLRDAIRPGCVSVVYDVACLWLPAGNAVRMQMLRLGLDDVGRAIGL